MPTAIKRGYSIIERRKGSKIIKAKFSNQIALHQRNIGTVDCGIVGTGINNVSHFYKWFNKVKKVINEFLLLQAFTTSNLLVDKIAKNRRGISEVKISELIK